MKIANIITSTDISMDLKYDVYNIVDFNTDYNKDIPTLFIGYTKTKEILDINILENKYNNLIWWTTSKEEKMVDYFKILNEFETNVLSFYKNIYCYKPFNFLLYKDRNFNDLIKLFSNENIRIYLNKRSVYVLIDKEIIGFDLNYFWYIDKPNTIKLLKKIISHKNCIYDKKNVILNKYKSEVHQKEIIERYIPVFYNYENKSN
jgi:hypothetical protein